jgi:hypothetical protein
MAPPKLPEQTIVALPPGASESRFVGYVEGLVLSNVHTSLYLPEAVYEGRREAAFRERFKIHDIVLEGIEMALRKRGRRG